MGLGDCASPDARRKIVRSLVRVLITYPLYYVLSMLAVFLVFWVFGFSLVGVFTVFILSSAVCIFAHYVNTWRDILFLCRELRKSERKSERGDRRNIH